MIPKSFQIMGFTIKIQITDDIDDHSDGRYVGAQEKIDIRPVSSKLTSDYQEQIFWHEAVHCILQMQSYDKLDKDEAFVDRIAQCLWQIDKTRKPK